jgi:PPOX class probable F420-dependent enzyme
VEPIIWLGTIRPDGRPHNVPVWFAWHDPMMLIFSMPDTAKVRDMQRSPAVSLALDSTGRGQDIVLAEGRAELVTADRHPHFLAGQFQHKYAQSLGSMPFEEWRSAFSRPVLIHVERIIAWTRTAAGLAYRAVPERDRAHSLPLDGRILQPPAEHKLKRGSRRGTPGTVSSGRS